MRIIDPKQFLMNLKVNASKNAAEQLKADDLIEVRELQSTFLVRVAKNEKRFYDELKKATSDYNQNAALHDFPAIDFDDLYTKYREYLDAMTPYLGSSSP